MKGPPDGFYHGARFVVPPHCDIGSDTEPLVHPPSPRACVQILSPALRLQKSRRSSRWRGACDISRECRPSDRSNLLVHQKCGEIHLIYSVIIIVNSSHRHIRSYSARVISNGPVNPKLLDFSLSRKI